MLDLDDQRLARAPMLSHWCFSTCFGVRESSSFLIEILAYMAQRSGSVHCTFGSIC